MSAARALIDKLGLAPHPEGGWCRETWREPAGESDIMAGEAVEVVVAPHAWQSAAPLPGEHGYVLVSCVVAPGFDFGGFELAAPGWEPGA